MAYGNAAEDFVSRGVVARVGPSALASRSAFGPRASSPIARRVTLYVVAHPNGQTVVIHPALLGDYEGLGFSLKKVVKNVVKATGKAVKDTGHVAGAAVTSTAGKTILGGALALTGVGIPLSAGIMATSQAGGQLAKKGGNLRKAGRGAVEGAVEGTVAGVAGKVLKAKAPGLVDKTRSAVGMRPLTPKKIAPPTAIPRTRVIPSPKGTPLVLKAVPDLIHTPTPPSAPTETATSDPLPSGAQVKPKGTNTNGTTRIGKVGGLVRRAAGAVTGAVDGASNYSPPPTVYNPGTGPLAQETGGGDEKPAGGLSSIPLPLLLGGGVVVLLLVTNHRR